MTSREATQPNREHRRSAARCRQLGEIIRTDSDAA
jgi:hypothetical protein